MYFYLYNANNSFQHIVVDDSGVPISQKTITLKTEDTNEMRQSLEASDNLLIFGRVITDEEYQEIEKSHKMKKHVFLYNDEKVDSIFKEFESEEDWENFFNEKEIQKEVALSPVNYIIH